jgi:hypothetical protein
MEGEVMRVHRMEELGKIEDVSVTHSPKLLGRIPLKVCVK